MKHVDQQSCPSIGKIENILLAGILLFSVWGGYHFLKSPDEEIVALNPAQLTLSAPDGNPPTNAFPVKSPAADHLVVYGSPKAGAPLQFDIKSYNLNARYKLSFGDGRSEEINAQTIQHTYRQPGKFRLKLWVEFKGREEILYSGTLYVRESADLAQRD